MKNKKLKSDYKVSVTVKSLSLMILLSIVILVFIEGFSFYYMSSYNKKTLENYRNSLELYCNYWDNKLDIINNSLISLGSTNNTDVSYWNVCNAEEGLAFQTSKTLLGKRISEIAWNHENDIQVFVCVPERDVYIKSINHLVEMKERSTLENDIREYIETMAANNSTQWGYFRSGQYDYFMNVYLLHGGYIGAVVRCDTILDGLKEEKGSNFEAVIVNEEGEKLFPDNAEKNKTDDDAGSFFLLPMRNIGCQFEIYYNQNLFGSGGLLWIFPVLTIIFGVLLLGWNIRFQMKNVLGPLNTLKNAMLHFSQGLFDVRLEANQKEEEINVLFRTFNYMAEQIAHLKIKIYESKLERELIQSNYMRVQIQPHFYTNILNLIYGLAQIGDYQAIQKLALTTGAYFRYLLGEKGTFVLLKEEMECVRNYIKIQEMRYEGYLVFDLEADEDMGTQMVLPLILQTFAGNCVKHNITLVPVLHIKIRIAKKDEKIHITVWDNGRGFEPDVLDRINAGQDISKNGEHIGIRNVKQRLMLFYGDTASVKIQSAPGDTKITVILPEVITQEEKNEYHIS